MRIDEILIERGWAREEDLCEAAETHGAEDGRRSVEDILLERGVITESQHAECLAIRAHAPYIETIDDDLLDAELVDELPVEWARANAVLPIRFEGRVCALTGDPGHMDAVRYLSLLLHEELDPVVAPRTRVQRAIERAYYRRETAAEDMLEGMRAEGGAIGADTVRDDLLKDSARAPVTRFVNRMLLDALKAGASDIHIEPYEQSITVRFRLDGLLYERLSPPKELERSLVSRLKVMARLDIAESRLPQDGMARVNVGDREFDIRVSTIPVAEGERIVLRLLNTESALLPMEHLGMDAQVLNAFRQLLREPQGILLVTGPTGSGKTTTLYAALQELDKKHLNIMTIEDPIEYQLPEINQIQVKPRIGMTFAQGLRHILRQDPDVVLVGETRDLETAEIAIRASLTGHLVFSTLHTNDAAGAPVRLTDMGIPPYLLSTALRAVMAQRLVRKLCPHCRTKGAAGEGLDLRLSDRVRERLGDAAWRTAGCPQCMEGYRGRIGLFELMQVGDALRQAIREAAPMHELERAARADGMIPIQKDAIEKAADGMTDLHELVRVLGPAALSGYDNI